MLPILPFAIPKLMTYQRDINRRSVRLGDRVSRGTLAFSAISRAMMRNVEDIGSWHLVYNGVPLRLYDFVPEVADDAPLVFLGRLEEIKGPHIAIEVAARLNARLILAGNIPDRDWFARAIAPRLDGERICYVGPVTDAREERAARRAPRALLMPILWEEPFGIVMAEAMACGTPVIGFSRRGSVAGGRRPRRHRLRRRYAGGDGRRGAAPRRDQPRPGARAGGAAVLRGCAGRRLPGDLPLAARRDEAAAMKALVKRLMRETPYRLVRAGALNRFDAVDECLRAMRERGLRPSRIVDCGANVGAFATAAATHFPEATVDMIEPQPACSTALTALRRSRGFGYFPVALVGPDHRKDTISLAIEPGRVSTGAISRCSPRARRPAGAGGDGSTASSPNELAPARPTCC